MATLTISIATLTSEITASDANASRVFQTILTGRGYDINIMSNREQLDTVIVLIKDYIVDMAKELDMEQAINTAKETSMSNPPDFTD